MVEWALPTLIRGKTSSGSAGLPLGQDGRQPRVGKGLMQGNYSRHPFDLRASLLVLDAVGVSRMVVAHTVQPQGINSACNGQVWRVDVGMSAHYGGSAAGLEIVGDYVTPIEID